MKRWILGLACAAALALATPPAAVAQNLFEPVAKVNDSVITAFERDQRMQMLELFQFPGDIAAEAVTRLIEERLQVAEARRMGLTLTEAEIVAGETEFATRANLSREEFLTILEQFGVAPESYRDFVTAGLYWRRVAQTRFGGPNTVIREDDVDRALGTATLEGGPRVLLYEVVLPAATPDQASAAQRRAAEVSRIEVESEFRTAAFRLSAAGTRFDGGARDWVAIEAMPPEVQAAILSLPEGQASAPVQLEDAVAVYWMRERRDVPETAPGTETLDYVELYLAGGQSPETRQRAAEIAALAQTCDDLYGLARDLPPEALQRQTLTVGQIPAEVRAELDRMDPDEVSTSLTRNNGQTLVFLMLCDRLQNPDAETVRDRVAEALQTRQIGGKAAILLADLKANATIELY